MKLIKIIFVLCIVFATSCISHKKAHKSSKETDSSFVDKTKIKTIETKKLDTIIVVESDSLNGTVDLKDTTTQKIESGDIEIEFKANPKTGKGNFKVKTKPKEVHVNIDKVKTTVEDRNITVKIENKEEIKDTSKTSFNMFWIWIILIVIVLIWLIKKYGWKIVKKWFFPIG